MIGFMVSAGTWDAAFRSGGQIARLRTFNSETRCQYYGKYFFSSSFMR